MVSVQACGTGRDLADERLIRRWRAAEPARLDGTFWPSSASRCSSRRSPADRHTSILTVSMRSSPGLRFQLAVAALFVRPAARPTALSAMFILSIIADVATALIQFGGSLLVSADAVERFLVACTRRVRDLRHRDRLVAGRDDLRARRACSRIRDCACWLALRRCGSPCSPHIRLFPTRRFSFHPTSISAPPTGGSICMPRTA